MKTAKAWERLEQCSERQVRPLRSARVPINQALRTFLGPADWPCLMRELTMVILVSGSGSQEVVIRPIDAFPSLVNQSAPSGPAAMP